MKKATNRILSFLTAFAMVIGVLVAPFTSANAAEENISTKEDAVTNSVTLHKLMLTKSDLSNWKELTEDQYDGRQDRDALGKAAGKNLVEVPDVYFALKFADDYADEKLAGKYVKAGDDKLTPADPLASTENVEEAVGGLTKADGIKFNTSKLDGKFVIDEISEKSTYKGEAYFDAEGNELTKVDDKYYNADGTEFTDTASVKTVENNLLTGSLAVPVEITLPLVNKHGTVIDAHVYPKNSQDKPQIDKNFGKEDNTTDNTTDNTLEHADGFEDAAQGAGAQAGAKYENYTKTKETAKTELGKRVPYEVKSEIPANSRLATAKWDDKMTEGLTYNKDLVVKIGGKIITPTSEELTQTENGFVLSLQGDNLALLNGKDQPVEVELQYSATVNKNAMADIPESNNVMFHYGNNPNKGTTPIPTNPNENGDLTVEKSWDDGVWAEGESATFELRDANTGKVVEAKDLVFNEIEGESKDARDKRLEEFKNYKENTFNARPTIGYDKEEKNYTWNYLDPSKEYVAVEIASTPNSDAAYTEEQPDGTIKVVNYKSTNPTPLNPTSPKVVLGGKKFVKTNQDGSERLAGAEFYVKKGNEYLVAKTSAEQDAANIDVKAKKDALDAAVKAYNDLTAEQQKTDTEKKAAIDSAQDAYNKAFKEAAQGYKWEASKDNALVLVSDSQGRFEITGLEYGNYKLEEKKAPEGFATLTEDVPFEVKKGSYKGENTEFRYTEEIKAAENEELTDKQKADNDKTADVFGKQIKNKKVTIPQTGGIGSLIFIVAGLAIMGIAFVAMKKRNAVEA